MLLLLHVALCALVESTGAGTMALAVSCASLSAYVRSHCMSQSPTNPSSNRRCCVHQPPSPMLIKLAEVRGDLSLKDAAKVAAEAGRKYIDSINVKPDPLEKQFDRIQSLSHS